MYIYIHNNVYIYIYIYIYISAPYGSCRPPCHSKSPMMRLQWVMCICETEKQTQFQVHLPSQESSVKITNILQAFWSRCLRLNDIST